MCVYSLEVFNCTKIKWSFHLFPYRAPHCWTMGRCSCLCSLWRGGPLTSSATSVSCLCSTLLSPHRNLPNWPVLHSFSHGHYITMVITLTDTHVQPARLKRGIESHFKQCHMIQKQSKFTTLVKCKVYCHFNVCLWSSSLQLQSGRASWLTTQASPSKTLSLFLCCSMSNGEFLAACGLVAKQLVF